jgi:N-acetyl sugar amidotransferase
MTIQNSSTGCDKASQVRQCAVCVLDMNDDPSMTFDENGVCQYLHQYKAGIARHVPAQETRQQKLDTLVAKIRNDGKGRAYDVIVGVSGGVDSTYVALLAKELGLRVLAVHCDNGWNSELAVKNIENIVSRLGIDLFTYVIDWEEFRDIQLAFIKASVVDIELVSDHAIFATLYKQAAKHGVKHILSGTNVVTECTLPPHWIWHKTDHVHIQAIHREFGTRPLKTYPFMDWKVKRLQQMLGRVTETSILHYVPYVKADVKRRIIDELGWRDYGGKHYESIFTRFYQGYILPTKFGIDKRKAHLSDLIFAGQITKEQALAEIQQPICDPEQLKVDREFVLKKLGLSEAEFTSLMKQPPRRHQEFPVERGIFETYRLLMPLKWPVQLLKGVLGARRKSS